MLTAQLPELAEYSSAEDTQRGHVYIQEVKKNNVFIVTPLGNRKDTPTEMETMVSFLL